MTENKYQPKNEPREVQYDPPHEPSVHDYITPFERTCLHIRNILAAIAALLFLISIFPNGRYHHLHGTLQGIAYFFGAGAYIAEMVEASDAEKRASKHFALRSFMPNIFGVLYLILGFSHFFD